VIGATPPIALVQSSISFLLTNPSPLRYRSFVRENVSLDKLQPCGAL